MPPLRTAVVLTHLLAAYPAPFTIDELMRELTDASEEHDDCDAVAQAVRALLAAGLIQRHGDFLLPTRAAVHCNQVSKA